MLGVLAIILSISAVVFVCAVGRAAYLRDKMQRLMQRLAYERGGVIRGATAEIPGLEPGAVVEACLHTRGQLFWRTYSLELVFPKWAEEGLELETFTRSLSWMIRGWRRLRTKDRRFDRRFAVYGQPLEAVQRQLAPSVRSRLELLANIWPRGFHVTIRDGDWRIVLHRPDKNRTAVLEAVEVIYGVLDEACSVLGRGVEIVRNGHQVSAEVAVCKVCGEGFGEDVVYCSSCSTPHHKDCWRYIGQCSVFACGGKRAQRKLTPTNA